MLYLPSSVDAQELQRQEEPFLLTQDIPCVTPSHLLQTWNLNNRS